MLDVVGKDILTKILLYLDEPKDIILLLCNVSKSIRSYIKKLHWSLLIKKHYWNFFHICKDKEKIHIPAEYKHILKVESKPHQFYLLAREEHESQFGMPQYGVCDSPEQLARRFPKYEGKVYLTEIRRCDQPKKRGWRWRKQGHYYGEMDPEPEHVIQYLSEADGRKGRPYINEQWTFSRHQEDCSYGVQIYYFDNGKIKKK